MRFSPTERSGPLDVGVHAAARSVGFAMLVRREANGVALALGGLDPLRNTPPLSPAPLA